MTDQDKELRRLAEAATPGPWRYELDGPKSNDMRHAVLAEVTDLWIVACYRSGTTPEDDSSEAADAEAEANARLIAAANPAAVLSLLDRLEAAECDAARYRFVRTADRIRISTKAARDPVAYDEAIDAAMHKESES